MQPCVVDIGAEKTDRQIERMSYDQEHNAENDDDRVSPRNKAESVLRYDLSDHNAGKHESVKAGIA